MSWTCEHIESRLSDYVDGLLEPAERQAFAAHVQACAHCAPLVSSVSSLVRGLRKIEQLAEPPRLVYNILDKTLGPRETAAGWRAVLGWLNAIATPRFVYGALSVGATFAILLTAAGFNWRKPQLADLAPASVYRSTNRQAHLVYARGAKFMNDLRVVHEIQSRLRPETDLPAAPESTVPESTPQKQPGVTDGAPATAPRQQNRTNGMYPERTVLATNLAAVGPRRVS